MAYYLAATWTRPRNQQGDHIVIPYNKKTFEIEILECKPADAIQIIEADVQVKAQRDVCHLFYCE